jgi:E3 ubiquitin-protein ligase MARCH1/8
MTDDTTQTIETARSSKLFATSEDVCKICLDTSTPTHPLISPCKCSGTMKYVHQECLKTWVASRSEDLAKVPCELCKYTFKMHFDIKSKCSLKDRARCNTPRILRYIITVVLILGLISAASTITDQLSRKGNSHHDGLIIGLIVTCFFMLLLGVSLVMSVASDTRCVHQIKHWYILDYKPQRRRSRSAKVQNYDYPTEVNQDLSSTNHPQIFVVPNVIRVRGLYAQMPELMPSMSRVRSTSQSLQIFAALPSSLQGFNSI